MCNDHKIDCQNLKCLFVKHTDTFKRIYIHKPIDALLEFTTSFYNNLMLIIFNTLFTNFSTTHRGYNPFGYFFMHLLSI